MQVTSFKHRPRSLRFACASVVFTILFASGIVTFGQTARAAQPSSKWPRVFLSNVERILFEMVN